MAPPPGLKKGEYDDRIEEKKKLWPQARKIHQWLKTLPEGAANITITNRYKDAPEFRAALNPANVRLGFLRLGKDGTKDITKKPLAIVKTFAQLFECWFVRKKLRIKFGLPLAPCPRLLKRSQTLLKRRKKRKSGRRVQFSEDAANSHRRRSSIASCARC